MALTEIREYYTSFVNGEYVEDPKGTCLTIEYEIDEITTDVDSNTVTIKRPLRVVNSAIPLNTTSRIYRIQTTFQNKDTNDNWVTTGQPLYQVADDTSYVNDTGVPVTMEEATEFEDDLSKPILDNNGDPVLDGNGDPVYAKKRVLKTGYFLEPDFLTAALSPALAPVVGGAMRRKTQEVYGS